jgi:hypothetical protein|tara:strand:+ start:179 stop:511 length:333 start_codon:yes stop_codon:yes gene_type:complete
MIRILILTFIVAFPAMSKAENMIPEKALMIYEPMCEDQKYMKCMGEKTPTQCKFKAQSKVSVCLEAIDLKYSGQDVPTRQLLQTYSKCVLGETAKTNGISVQELGDCLRQ